MTKLEKLYGIIQNSKELGLDLGEDVLRQTNELEEQIIRDEILPVIGKDIEPTLRQIKRKLVLVVDYDPDKTLSVRMTRKRVVTDDSETKEYPLLPLGKPIEPKKSQMPHVIVNVKTHLRVTLQNGKVFEDKKALNTFLSVIDYIGLEKVEALNIIIDRLNLVMRHPIDNGARAEWHTVGDWNVNTHSNTQTKARQLMKISKALKLKMKIEVK